MLSLKIIDDALLMEGEDDSLFVKLFAQKQKIINLMKEGKPFEISKQQVMEAYKCIKANNGAAGTDGVNFVKFEKDLK